MSKKTLVMTLVKSLDSCRAVLKELEEQATPYKEQEEVLRDKLVRALQERGMASVKAEDGSIYSRATRVSYGVVDAIKALSWAKENNCISVDKAKATKIIKPLLETPEGFERQETNYLSIKRATEQEAAE